MRQGQQNRRGRGRNNNNRKSQNPLTRSFESNGPDVKIRGTPAHIAEKYITLARDAQSSGDPVLAESYLQHAEHYNRIIMAFREQQIQQGGDPGQIRRPQGLNDFGDSDEFGDDDSDDANGVGEYGVVGANDPQPAVRNFEGQSRQDGHRDGGRGDGGRNDHQRSEGRGRGDFQFRQNRDRNQGGRQNDHRNNNGEGQGHDRGDQPRNDQSRNDQPRNDQPRNDQPRNDQPRREPREPRENQRGEGRQENGGRRSSGEGRGRRDFGGSAAGGEQPEFLRRSVRRPRREEPAEGVEAAPAPAEANSEKGE